MATRDPEQHSSGTDAARYEDTKKPATDNTAQSAGARSSAITSWMSALSTQTHVQLFASISTAFYKDTRFVWTPIPTFTHPEKKEAFARFGKGASHLDTTTLPPTQPQKTTPHTPRLTNVPYSSRR